MVHKLLFSILGQKLMVLYMFKTYLIIYTLTGTRKIVIAESKEEAIELFIASANKFTFYHHTYCRCIELKEKGIVEI